MENKLCKVNYEELKKIEVPSIMQHASINFNQEFNKTTFGSSSIRFSESSIGLGNSLAHYS